MSYIANIPEEKKLIDSQKKFIELLKLFPVEKLSYYSRRVLTGEYKHEVFPTNIILYDKMPFIMIINNTKNYHIPASIEFITKIANENNRSS